MRPLKRLIILTRPPHAGMGGFIAKVEQAVPEDQEVHLLVSSDVVIEHVVAVRQTWMVTRTEHLELLNARGRLAMPKVHEALARLVRTMGAEEHRLVVLPAFQTRQVLAGLRGEDRVAQGPAQEFYAHLGPDGSLIGDVTMLA